MPEVGYQLKTKDYHGSSLNLAFTYVEMLGEIFIPKNAKYRKTEYLSLETEGLDTSDR